MIRRNCEHKKNLTDSFVRCTWTTFPGNMTTEFVDRVKEGYVRLKSRNLGVWQKRWIVFRKASSTGPKRLEKFMDERCANHRGYHKIIILDHVIKVARLPSDIKKHGVIVTFSDNSRRQFACNSELDADSWCKTFAMDVCPENSGILSSEPDILLSGLQREKNERFHVFLQQSSCLSLSGECTLQVTEDNIYLWDVFNPKLKLVTWPLQSLRRYGQDNCRFLLESGRYCDTGEGMFTFTTTQGQEIYQRVHRLSMVMAASQEKNRLDKNIRTRLSGDVSVMPDFLDENVRQAHPVEQPTEVQTYTTRHSSNFHIPLDSPRRTPCVILRTLVPKEGPENIHNNHSTQQVPLQENKKNNSDMIINLDKKLQSSEGIWIPRNLCSVRETHNSLETTSKTRSTL